jgi:hypothetical protein
MNENEIRLMIKETDKRILDALRCAIKGTTVTWGEELDEAAWRALYRTAAKHNILPLVADALPCVLPEPYAKQTRHAILGQAERTAELGLLMEHLYGLGLRPLVIKGLVCRSLYPEPEHRPSTDEDLLVDPAEFMKLHNAMMSYGLELVNPEADLAESFEVSYRDLDQKLYVEVHTSLFTRNIPYLNRMNEGFRSAHVRAVTQTAGGISVRTLCPNDHLLYLILHALKHFLHSGVGIRQVCDIALYSAENRDRISWGGLRRTLAELGALDFARALYGIADKYLLPDEQLLHYLAGWEIKTIDFEPLLDDIMDGGLYGTSTKSRAHSATMTLNATVEQRTDGMKALMHAVFQPCKSMKKRYRYLEKAPFLLPVAWGHRLLRYGAELLRGDRRTNSALDSIRVGSERIRLLQKYHIIDDKK